MPRRNWSDDERAAALELLADPESSYYDVHKVTGIPASTLCDWAGKAGMTGHTRQEQTEAARAARHDRIALKRAVIAEKLLDAVETFADEAVLAKPRDAQSLMTAAAIAVDKFRLEMGEHTTSTRSESVDIVDAARSKVDELAARRRKTA